MPPSAAPATTRHSAPRRAARHCVAFLVYDGVTLLDVAGPAEVFKEANRFGADYRIVLLSPTGDDVTSNLGVRLAVEGAVSSEPEPHTFLVPGSSLYPRTVVPQDLAEAVRVPAARAGRVASICTGAFILAAAGLLDGKRATTHWKVTHELAAEYPTCRVESDAIYVRDGTTYTSAGVTAGIDLALALVEEDHGPDLTRDVARALVVYPNCPLHRPGTWRAFDSTWPGRCSIKDTPRRTPRLSPDSPATRACDGCSRESCPSAPPHTNAGSAQRAAPTRNSAELTRIPPPA